uniref:Transmembrane protease serine 4-like n=1 Tax=Phascolarctos cinereus TaxID=38626 RepID=A0A6P5K518_PHACI|nr:transmembrane protease serine 4-like [Phascolarctos cinereus]
MDTWESWNGILQRSVDGNRCYCDGCLDCHWQDLTGEKVCDRHKDCALGQDEEHCVESIPSEDVPVVGVCLSKDRSTLQMDLWSSACFDNFTEAWAKIACTQMGYNSLSMEPSFQAVKIGPEQQLPVSKITAKDQELQVQNFSGPCLSMSLVSLHCAVYGENLLGPQGMGGQETFVKILALAGQHSAPQNSLLWWLHTGPLLDPHRFPLLQDLFRGGPLENRRALTIYTLHTHT